MNSRNSSKELSLPIGYKFAPTGFELSEFYLIPKLKGQSLPSNFVMDFNNVYAFEPHQLPFNQSKYARANEAYFFTEDLRKNSAEQIPTTPNGQWKVYDDNVPINRAADEVVGFKTKLIFYDANGNPTDWRMHEFRCCRDRIPITTTNMKNYIICRVKLKKKEEEISQDESGTKNQEERGGDVAR